ncbi:MAG: nucleoside triphosphate pyrophosphohydrolase, partial [Armatimonadota bacterium]
KRAAAVGFEWPNREGVWAKLDEEKGELEAAILGGDRDAIESEVGDLLFTAVNLARWAGVEPELALRRMLDRFADRFRRAESDGQTPLESLTPEEWDARWQRAKSETA